MGRCQYFVKGNVGTGISATEVAAPWFQLPPTGIGRTHYGSSNQGPKSGNHLPFPPCSAAPPFSFPPICPNDLHICTRGLSLCVHTAHGNVTTRIHKSSSKIYYRQNSCSLQYSSASACSILTYKTHLCYQCFVLMYVTDLLLHTQ